jgi:hypothetical protein
MICKRCNKWFPYHSKYEQVIYHNCVVNFWRRIEEFGECVKG